MVYELIVSRTVRRVQTVEQTAIVTVDAQDAEDAQRMFAQLLQDGEQDSWEWESDRDGDFDWSGVEVIGQERIDEAIPLADATEKADYVRS